MAAPSPNRRFTHRPARLDDVPALKLVMQSAIGELQKGFLTPDAIVASREVMGLDTQLILDGTYFIIEENGARFRAVCGTVFLGGVARLLSWRATGRPHPIFVAAIGLELLGMPALVAWQAMVETRSKALTRR